MKIADDDYKEVTAGAVEVVVRAIQAADHPNRRARLRIMATIPLKEINGEFDLAALDRLGWPIAWSGAPDREYEAALKKLRDEGRALIDSTTDAVSVVVKGGEIVSVVRELLDDNALDIAIEAKEVRP